MTAESPQAGGQLARAKQLEPTDPDPARVLARETEKQMGPLPTAWQKVRAQMLLGDVYEAIREMPSRTCN